MFKPIPLDEYEGGLVLNRILSNRDIIESPYGIIAFFGLGKSMSVVLDVSETLEEASKIMDREECKWIGSKGSLVPMTVYKFYYRKDSNLLIKEDMLPLTEV